MPIDLARALLRGRFMRTVAVIERVGVPIDTELLERLNRNWPMLRARLVERIDQQYGVYEGLTFKAKRFAEWLNREGIPWPQLDTGGLSLSDDTFRNMALAYPQLGPLHELRGALSKMRLSALEVGRDGRNRCLLSPFSSRTGRNQPSTTRFIFGLSAWMRGDQAGCRIRLGVHRLVATRVWCGSSTVARHEDAGRLHLQLPRVRQASWSSTSGRNQAIASPAARAI